jgi:glycerol-3-phosphate acyltransferase PlsY
LATLVYVLVGYASLTTISIALSALGIFTIRAANGINPWYYAFMGAAAVITVTLALLPNLKRLIAGTERRVDLIARLFKKSKY